MIIFMGIAGSGKSTQGQLLAAHLHCPWLSTGSLLRQKMDPATQQLMLKGEIIDDKRTLAVLDEEFKRVHADRTQCILDGSPRTLAQAEWLVAQARAGQLDITGIIHLTTNINVAEARLLARQRPDDHKAAIAERFSEYEQAIKPILNYLKEQGFTIHNVDGGRDTDLVAADIRKALGV